MNRFRSALLAVVMSVGAFAYAPHAAAKDTLVIGIQDNSVSLDPAACYEIVGGALIDKLYDTLVAFDQGDFTKIAPRLAESWDVSPDGNMWTFHLRKDVTFSSGNPMNADAVVFSLRRVLKLAKDPSWLLTQFGIKEESIVKLDDFTVQITLDQPYAPNLFLSAAMAFSVASILDPETVLAHEQNGDLGSAWLDDNAAGSGAYLLEQRTRGEVTVFKASPKYWRGQPAFQTVVVNHVGDSTEQAALLAQGKIDVAWNLTPESVSMLSSRTDMQVMQTGVLNVIHLVMNLGYAPFAKPEVRQAIRYAIDYDGLIQNVLGGAGLKVQTFIPQGMFGHNPALPYNHDIAKAKELLASAGYPDGFDLTINCFDFSPWEEVSLSLKTDLAKVGIRVTVNPRSPKETRGDLRSRTYQATLIQWLSDYPDPDGNAKGFAYAPDISETASFKQKAWQSNYLNPETTKLVEQATMENDEATRKALYQQITDMILVDGPYAILYQPIRQYAVRNEIADQIGEPNALYLDFPVFQ